MKALSICSTLGLVLVLGGCASLASKPKTFDQLGQFTAYPLNKQIIRVSFQAGNQFNYGTAEEITLLKAAQTTLQQGFRYFTVRDDPSNARHKTPRQAVIYPSPAYYPFGYSRRYPAFWSNSFYDMPQVVNLDPIEISYTIECFQNQQQSPEAFDAQLILQSLGKKYGLSATGQVLQPSASASPKK